MKRSSPVVAAQIVVLAPADQQVVAFAPLEVKRDVGRRRRPEPVDATAPDVVAVAASEDRDLLRLGRGLDVDVGVESEVDPAARADHDRVVLGRTVDRQLVLREPREGAIVDDRDLDLRLPVALQRRAGAERPLALVDRDTAQDVVLGAEDGDPLGVEHGRGGELPRDRAEHAGVAVVGDPDLVGDAEDPQRAIAAVVVDDHALPASCFAPLRRVSRS
jgi:hypothetical protein